MIPVSPLPTLSEIKLDETPVQQRNRMFSTTQAMDELIAERKRVEEYTQEQYNRLSRLRELIRSERTAADAELVERRREVERLAGGAMQEEMERLRQNLHIVTMERDVALKQLLALRRDATTSTPREDFSIMSREHERDLQQLCQERDDARQQVRQLTEQLQAEREEARLQTAKVREEMEWQERELVAERRRLLAERRRLEEEAREVILRYNAQLQETAAVAAKPTSSRDLCLLEAELREMKDIIKEQIDKGWADLHKEQLRLAKLREKLHLEESM